MHIYILYLYMRFSFIHMYITELSCVYVGLHFEIWTGNDFSGWALKDLRRWFTKYFSMTILTILSKSY